MYFKDVGIFVDRRTEKNAIERNVLTSMERAFAIDFTTEEEEEGKESRRRKR